MKSTFQNMIFPKESTLCEMDDTSLLEVDGGVFLEAVALGMGITYGILEAYKWGQEYAHARLHPSN